jgi:hypothetical protein
MSTAEITKHGSWTNKMRTAAAAAAAAAGEN